MTDTAARPLTLPDLPTTIVVTNQKGGVGKTTTAVGFAEVLKRIYGAEAVVLDIDPQRGAILWSEEAEAAGSPLAASVIDPPEEVTPVRLAGWVRREFTNGEILIIDCPPGHAHTIQDAAVEIAVERGGLVVLPTSPDKADVKSTAPAWVVNAERSAAVILMVRVENGTVRQREAREDLERNDDPEIDLGATVMETEVLKRQALSRETYDGVPERSVLVDMYHPVIEELARLWS